MYFFTADEHYFHSNIIKYCKRPFGSVWEMNNVLVDNHNAVVDDIDTVFHLGDFSLGNVSQTLKWISKLKGQHVFLRGSHDRWFKDSILIHILEMKIEKRHIVMCHYPFRSWPKSHYGSWNLHGHSHGNMEHLKHQWDVGVDNNNYTPVSFQQLKEVFKCQNHKKE